MGGIFDCTLCIAIQLISGANDEFVNAVQTCDKFKRVVWLRGEPEVDFKEVKESGEPIVILIAGPPARGVMRYLCDDYNLPKEQRRVRWIHSLSSGLDTYKLHELLKELKDIPFTNGRGCYSPVLAEHVMYAMLYFYRQTWRSLQSRAERKWDPFTVGELRGKKLGIIGYGDIGQATARLAAAFGMEVTGVRRSTSTETVDKLGTRIVQDDAGRDRVIRESDFVVNVLPGTEKTRHFFNKDRFAMMKPSAVYINIGRGISHKEEDLACALRDGVIRGAAVDVFEVEPLPTASPLWDISDDKLLVTFHSAFMTEGFGRQAVEYFMGRANIFGTEQFASCAFYVDENFAVYHCRV